MMITEQGRTEALLRNGQKTVLVAGKSDGGDLGFHCYPDPLILEIFKRGKASFDFTVIHRIRYQDPDAGLVEECLFMAKEDRLPAYLYGIIVNADGQLPDGRSACI